MKLSDITSEALKDVKIPVAKNDKGRIEVSLPDGSRGSIAPEMEDQAIKDGLHILTPEEYQRENELEEAGNSPVLASAVSGLRGLTMGLSDQIITQTGLLKAQELKDLQEANPVASGISETVGTVAPLFFTGGTGPLAKLAVSAPTALAELAGKKAIEKIGGKLLANTTSNVVKNAVKYGVGSTVEGALYGVGKLISEDALGDAEFNAENVLASAGEGALFGGAVGLTTGYGAGALKKGITKAAEKTQGALKGFIDNEIGFLKSAGAEKGHIKNILKKESLTPKDLNNYAMDIGRGATFTAADIVEHGGIPELKKGSKSLKEAAFTSLDDLEINNATVKEGAGNIMGNVLDDAQAKYLSKLESGELKKSDLIFGDDLAEFVQKEFADEIGQLHSPKAKEIEELIKDLREINVTRDLKDGSIIQKLPLTPAELKAQSRLFAEEAGFSKIQPSRKQQAYQSLWGKTEDHITKVLDDLGDAGAGKRYKDAKKLYEKGITLDKIIESGRSKAVNNRGLSLTQGLATVAGGTIGGLPGAAVGYGLRSAQQEYGDKITSYFLRGVEQASNKGKVDISDAVEAFFKSGSSTGRALHAATIKAATGAGIDALKEKDIKDKITNYSQEPSLIVDNFVKNNQDLINAAPKTSEAIQNRVLTGAQFLSSKLPRKPDSVFDDNDYSRADMLKFKNYVEAVEQPYKILDGLKKGYVTPEAMEAFSVVYPKMAQAIKNEFAARIPDFKKITEKQKAELTKILGIDSRKAYSPQGFATLQGVSAQGVQRDLEQNQPNKASTTGAKTLKQSNRTQSGLDKTLYRQ